MLRELVISLTFTCFLATLPSVANESQTKADLAAVQAELKKSQAAYDKQSKSFTSLKKRLKSFELEIARSAKALALTKQGISENKQQQYALKTESQQLNRRKKNLQRLLAAQLKSAYVTGSHDYSKMLLSQQKTSALERTISYYDYFNKARINQLEDLKKIFLELEKNQQELEKVQQRLVDLLEQQQVRQNELQLAQKQRQTHLQNLNEQLQQTQSAIAYLEENETTLKTTLEALAEVQAPSEEVFIAQLDGLRRLKGKLAWPLKGRLTKRFGQRKHAGMSWKGVMISGDNGDEITSVAPGHVVYADWLNGFGWVIVLDHGEGFMSLYGHAQTLLRDVGDHVNPGDAIALVGQSGGQQNPGLYFEIRHKGSAVNPVKWCRSS
ncbi:peptidoglycan DD-metalloendopeptidase family protein [Pseudoalteromonas luteoviolacea]|uniref:murein hydrolase activator EnvC family protein n=1 Tax=Pseudoalteromonas luteoviolacea TaxID=43657 RepID=UPI001B3861CD|nr:peptidoglycan DD-metalloendopeptidase family protein [Pseudoalteromonas luteoviolacea]MBQ4813645.1 peptidoglycan DD-metalloendopeptidase family protein [Pseudoalteromonas luteoviolacea]